MRRITWIAAAAAVASMVPGAAAAAVEPIKINFAIGRPENFDDVPHKRGVSKQDRKYMAETWNLHLFEVMAGELAMDNGRSVWTRQFGEDMVREHSLALIELKQLARNKGVNLPDYLSGKYANMLAKLERLDGNDFDRAYRQMMVSGHGNAEKLMAREVKFGRDEFVRGYATKMLASTDTHQKLAMHHQVVVLDRSATRGTAAQPMRP